MEKALPSRKFVLAWDDPGVTDRQLEALLHEVYVEGHFTDPETAATLFTASSVRSRGEILVAKDAATNELLGMVILVAPSSPARHLAGTGECEMHLLAVQPRHRSRGIARALVSNMLNQAKLKGFTAMVLWTQPLMLPAQQLYRSAGFVRSPQRDFRRNDRDCLVFQTRV